MRGKQLARQWRILPTIESRNQGATVAELAVQEGSHTRTICRDLAATMGKYVGESTQPPQEEAEERTW